MGKIQCLQKLYFHDYFLANYMRSFSKLHITIILSNDYFFTLF